ELVGEAALDHVGVDLAAALDEDRADLRVGEPLAELEDVDPAVRVRADPPDLRAAGGERLLARRGRLLAARDDRARAAALRQQVRGRRRAELAVEDDPLRIAPALDPRG